MRPGRPATIGKLILHQAKFHSTVAELVIATGADPKTVRKALIRASDRGEIVLRRFVKGKSGRAMVITGVRT
jgi:hypothetical protein